MASISVQQVLLELLDIAQKESRLRDRNVAARWRAKQFIADLTAADLGRDATARLTGELVERLGAALRYSGPDTMRGRALAEALKVLMGGQGKTTNKGGRGPDR